MVYHVLNRGVGRGTLFEKDGDFIAFEKVLEETLRTCRMRICVFCIMSNHFHAVVWPESDGDLPDFMQQMTNMHVKRWKEHRHEIGYGLTRIPRCRSTAANFTIEGLHKWKIDEVGQLTNG